MPSFGRPTRRSRRAPRSSARSRSSAASWTEPSRTPPTHRRSQSRSAIQMQRSPNAGNWNPLLYLSIIDPARGVLLGGRDRPMSRVGQAALASIVAVGIAVVAPVATLGSGDGFVHQSKAPAPLLSRTTYIVTGTKTADGCHYTYPELRLRASETTPVQRDVGIG